MKQKFINARDQIVGCEGDELSKPLTAANGIGTLGERTLHAVLKTMYEPDLSKHEVKVGRYHIDIVREDGFVEIHTRGFQTLRRKLSDLLADHPVTIVYPVASRKWLVWISPDTGEMTKKRRSPKNGTVYDAFFELYKIKPLLRHPHLKLDIILLEMVEYRSLSGWSDDRKKGSRRIERIHIELVDIMSIHNIGEYSKLVPEELSAPFTSDEYAKASGLPLRRARTALNVLRYVEAVLPVGKKGNAIVYQRSEKTANGSSN